MGSVLPLGVDADPGPAQDSTKNTEEGSILKAAKMLLAKNSKGMLGRQNEEGHNNRNRHILAGDQSLTHILI